MKVPATWHARSPSLGTVRHRGCCARRSRCYSHLKHILKLDRLRLRGPNGAHDEFLLAATAQNLRKLTKLIPMPNFKPAEDRWCNHGRVRSRVNAQPNPLDCPTFSTKSAKTGLVQVLSIYRCSFWAVRGSSSHPASRAPSIIHCLRIGPLK